MATATLQATYSDYHCITIGMTICLFLCSVIEEEARELFSFLKRVPVEVADRCGHASSQTVVDWDQSLQRWRVSIWFASFFVYGLQSVLQYSNTKSNVLACFIFTVYWHCMSYWLTASKLAISCICIVCKHFPETKISWYWTQFQCWTLVHTKIYWKHSGCCFVDFYLLCSVTKFVNQYTQFPG